MTGNVEVVIADIVGEVPPVAHLWRVLAVASVRVVAEGSKCLFLLASAVGSFAASHAANADGSCWGGETLRTSPRLGPESARVEAMAVVLARGLLSPPVGIWYERSIMARTGGNQPARPTKTVSAPPPNLLAEWVREAGLGDEVRAALVTWLAKQMVSDQYAKLEQGGHLSDGIPLRKVFVDLPVSEQQLHDATQRGERQLFLATLLKRKPAPLGSRGEQSGQVAMDEQDLAMPRGGARTRARHGFLVIGGPGQGKSTLGQLACQVHRAAVLSPYVEGLSTQQRDVARTFLDPANRKDIGKPVAPMFPVRIVLPDAATWLARRTLASTYDMPALLLMLAEQSAAKGAPLPVAALHAFLVHAPVLLVLDGLDEVGATEDRTRLIHAVRDMLSSLGEAGAQGVVIATTRPQGYAGELDRIGVALATVYLAPLTREEALAYGAKLAHAKLAAQPEEEERTVANLRAAAEEPATQRLLSTPLQVTILVALVQRMGRPPSERWGLFERYYETIYDREVERRTYAAPLLRDQRHHIFQIHARVGLLLQVESEQAGGAQARMSRERLAEVADTVLREADFDDETRAGLVNRIVRAAEERLVFLVEPEPKKFGFEIRSLQEFMAAWALAADGDEAVEKRFMQVAKAPMFRAVSLFLASKMFTASTHLGGLADRVCKALDEDTGDAACRETRAGAMLALEILEEGSVLNQPRFAKALMKRAAGLLELPPNPEQARLGRVRGDDVGKVLAGEVGARLADAETEAAIGAWVTVVEAAGLGCGWAEALGQVAWERLGDAERVLGALADADVEVSQWLADRIEERPALVSPVALNRLVRIGRKPSSLRASWVAGYLELRRSWSNMGRVEVASSMRLEWRPLHSERASAWRLLAGCSDPPQAWKPWVYVAEFVREPNASALAATLRKLGVLPEQDQYLFVGRFASWPLAACLRVADTARELLEFAALAEAGALGDTQQWETAERRWSKPISLEAFIGAVQAPQPWGAASLMRAPPPGAVNIWSLSPDTGSVPFSLLPTLDAIGSGRLRGHLASMAWRIVGPSSPQRLAEFSWEGVERWSRAAGAVSLDVIVRGIRLLPDGSQWLDGLDRLGRERRVRTLVTPFVVELLAEIYAANPGLQGLAYWLRVELAYVGDALTAGAKSALVPAVAERVFADPGLHADASLVRVWLGAVTSDQVPAVLGIIGKQAAQEPGLWTQLVDFSSSLPSNAQETLLLALLRRHDLPRGVASMAVRYLRSGLHTRLSGLADRATWTRLGLHEPLPDVALPAAEVFTLPEAPVALSHIDVHHIRGLAALPLDLAPPAEPAQGQWTVIIGPNGAGKTTLLRAIALALRDLADPRIWPKGAFSPDWRRNGATDPSTIAVQLADERTYRVTVQKNGTESFVRDPHSAPTPFPVFAYGCRRGSALGDDKRGVDLGDDGGPEVATLFQEGAPLIHAETWLKEWDGAAAKDPAKNRPVYQAVLAALRQLLDVQEIVVSSDMQVLVSGPTVGERVPFAALSDGYLTTTGWFLDLVARWIELSRKHTGAVPADILGRMTGLVLLDEIDLHLHPRWQIDVIPRVKKLLPRMSFVVTTHNPLTLVGARPEEIWMLSTDGGEVRAERGVEAPMLLTGGQIYSRYFGIRDIYPSALGEALRRYGFLSGDPLRTDEEQAEMELLRAELKKAGIEPGWEETPRENAKPTPARKQVVRTKKGKTK